MLTAIIGVVVLLGGLIFFHEFGHYTIAKLFGVKVEVFSLGFGKKLLKWKSGETEYCISVFPLGGYVKLMGDDPYKGVPAADAERAFSTQKLYKRFLIVAAGPLANLLLAFVLFIAVFWFGQPMVATQIGTVAIGSPAWEAGLRPGDRVRDVSGQKVATWNELEDSFKSRIGEKADLLLQRDGKDVHVTVPVMKVKAKNVYGEEEEVGGLKGIGRDPLATMIGVSDPKSPAYVAGLRTGDLITKVDGKTVELWTNFVEAMTAAQAGGKPVTLTLKRKATPDAKDFGPEQTITLPGSKVSPEASFPLEPMGIFPSEVFVIKVTPNSPAQEGGLQAGDRIVKIDGKEVFNFDPIVDAVQEAGAKDQPVTLDLDRAGQKVTLTLKPVQSLQEDPLTRQKTKKFMVGFQPGSAFHEPELTKLIVRQPVALVAKAAEETKELAHRMLVSLGKLAIGQISVKNLGGPVLIASVAGKSLDAGVIPFLQMMALISINLFLLNLFPVPILDGGHLLFFLIEGIKGRPVSVRTMEIANQVGMVFILVLVGLTLFNDISRIVLH